MEDFFLIKMCFAPYISLSTFVIEFLLALFFLLRNPKDKLNRIIALMVFLLGFYQLNEFLICTTSLNIFTRLAMVTTPLLPAIAVSCALIMWRKKLKYYWHFLIYSPAVFFILMFALSNHYQKSAECMSVFIQYFPSLIVLSRFYGLYYLVYIVGACVLFYFASTIRHKHERILLRLGALGMLIFTIPAFVFVWFLPSMYINFPSVLCEFALLLAIELVVVIWYKEKHNIKF